MILHCAHPDRRRGINARDRNHRPTNPSRVVPSPNKTGERRARRTRVVVSVTVERSLARASSDGGRTRGLVSPVRARIDRLGLISRCPKGQHRRRVTVARQVRLTRFSRRTFRTIILFIVPSFERSESRRVASRVELHVTRARWLARISISSPRSFERGVRSV
jgi:hypothetical protein